MQTSPNTQATSINPLERNIALSLPAVDIETEIQTRLKKLARTVKMQGFRPGKVPLTMVAKQYGFQVRQEVMSDSVQRTFAEAVKNQDFRIAGYPRFQPANTGENADKFEFTATFEVYPEVVVGSLAGKKLARPMATVEDQDVDHTIDTLRKQRATFDKVDRAAQKGDLLVIDFVGKVNGAAFQGGSAENFSVALGEGRMLPDFENALTGVAPGGSKTFDIVFPADYNPELAGKTAQFEATVKLVNAPVLPEVNAEFAKGLGVEDGDMAKMRAEIKLNLERELKKRIQGRVKDQVMDALISVSQFDLPRSLVEMEISRLQQGAAKDLEARGVAAKDLSLPPELFLERAERRVKLGLILSEVVKRNDLKAKPEQVRAVIEENADSYEQPQQMVKWFYSQPERLAEVEALVLEDNVVEWAAGQMDAAEEKLAFDDLMGIKRA
jgi:trigger factor